jgi:DNA-binding NtrC family response regulator
MGMPGLDGMEILRLVREQHRFEEVVIITAFGSLGSVLEAITAGVFDYIVKPFRKGQIVDVVDRAMHSQQRKREDRQLRAACAREPYSDAEAAFRSEYLRRRIEGGAADAESLARSSGLSAEIIALALKESQASTESDEE